MKAIVKISSYFQTEHFFDYIFINQILQITRQSCSVFLIFADKKIFSGGFIDEYFEGLEKNKKSNLNKSLSFKAGVII